MGMGISLRGSAMGCPTGMSDTASSLYGLTAVSLVIEILQFSDFLDNLSGLLAVADRNSGGIVSSVFKLCKSIKNDGCRLFSSNISNYSTHTNSLLKSV